jgi:hypothetical protein
MRPPPPRSHHQQIGARGRASCPNEHGARIAVDRTESNSCRIDAALTDQLLHGLLELGDETPGDRMFEETDGVDNRYISIDLCRQFESPPNGRLRVG